MVLMLTRRRRFLALGFGMPYLSSITGLQLIDTVFGQALNRGLRCSFTAVIGFHPWSSGTEFVQEADAGFLVVSIRFPAWQ